MIKKQKLTIIILVLFLVVSCVFIHPINKKSRSQYHSTQLKKRITKNEDTEKTDYIDSNGQITIAADYGYATIIKRATGNYELEQYFDDKGEAINRYNGYYALCREYDGSGNNIKITYLNIDGHPMIMANGYAIEEREYNDNKQIISVKYYDTMGNPILTQSFGYGKINDYDENGKISKITYIDLHNNPMMTGQGYASVKRCYYCSDGPENGKVESEFYFDESGNPTSLKLGQYGVHKEYDEYGREIVLTFLTSDGEPIKTNKGYTTITRTYHANGNIATEKYFDLNGNPFSLAEGQYGIKNEDKNTIYLDQNGRETFNLKNLLYNHSLIVIPVVIILIFLSVVNNKWKNIVFLVVYIGAILYMTLLFRETKETKRPEILWYYKTIFINDEASADILKNIWLFIPLGAILFQLYPKKIVLLVPIILSIMIEGTQYVMGIGFCEVDDVISNSLGGWIGYLAGKLTADIKLGSKP